MKPWKVFRIIYILQPYFEHTINSCFLLDDMYQFGKIEGSFKNAIVGDNEMQTMLHFFLSNLSMNTGSVFNATISCSLVVAKTFNHLGLPYRSTIV